MCGCSVLYRVRVYQKLCPMKTITHLTPDGYLHCPRLLQFVLCTRDRVWDASRQTLAINRYTVIILGFVFPSRHSWKSMQNRFSSITWDKFTEKCWQGNLNVQKNGGKKISLKCPINTVVSREPTSQHHGCLICRTLIADWRRTWEKREISYSRWPW